ncbi:MAG: hypothetical protein ACRD9W_24300 [Terriglobia bacterium]
MLGTKISGAGNRILHSRKYCPSAFRDEVRTLPSIELVECGALNRGSRVVGELDSANCRRQFGARAIGGLIGHLGGGASRDPTTPYEANGDRSNDAQHTAPSERGLGRAVCLDALHKPWSRCRHLLPPLPLRFLRVGKFLIQDSGEPSRIRLNR